MKQKDFRVLFSLPVIVAALGYFVDIYDLLLFSIVRKPSLTALGVSPGDLLSQGEYLLQAQMGGLLLGGVLWGILGDKRGRLSVLFGSILLYSLANIVNGFITPEKGPILQFLASTGLFGELNVIDQYATLRFIAGIGLAGELGAGVTLVSESLPTHLRGYGTTIIATVGLLGAVLANFVSKVTDWRTAYFIGGALGLMLLVTRVSVFESGMFLRAKEKIIERGNFFQLFKKKERLVKFLGCIFIGLPIWYAIGILITFSPEFAAALGIAGEINAGDAVMASYLGLAAGDLSSGTLSQVIRSRKKVVALYLFLTLCAVILFLFMPVKTTGFFYACCFIVGVGIGYWALFVTIAAEQFGTNLRSTVATSVPNFIRGSVIPLTFLFKYLRDTLEKNYFASESPLAAKSLGIIYGALFIGICTIIIAYIALKSIDETYGRDLNFEEND